MPRDDDGASASQTEDSLTPLTQTNTPSSTVEALLHPGNFLPGSSNDDGVPANEASMMVPPYNDASQWVLPAAESASVGTPVSVSRMPVNDEALLQNPLNTNAFELLGTPMMRPLKTATDLSFAYTTGTSHALGSDDKQAVIFHCKVLAPLKSTRNWDRSAHTLFLNKAYNRNMALHFLLAVSHSELAIHFGQGSQPPQESQRHYQRGSELFLQAHNPFATPDHVSMMLSFLYMYMFWMRREHLDPTKLRDLSRAVLVHVRTYGLDTLCASDDVFSVDGACDGVITVSEQVLLARVITYLYDRDGFCCFFGCGGQFANYMNSIPQKRHRIWLRSRAAFFLPLSEVGYNEAGSEIEDAATIDVYFELIILHQEINTYSQSSVTHATAMKPRLQQRLEAIYKDQGTLFHQATEQSHDSQCTLMAYVTVTVFYALQIYLYRARQCAFGTRPIPAEIQDALNSLVSAAYYATKTGQVQLLERFQWSLFIAGLEVTDPVHQEWIGNNMSDPAIKKGFDHIQAFKRRSAGGITVQNIRALIDESLTVS
ncbi:putative Zn(II)2Cys6 transcription factor [Aspergillus mulundensis]|uniref:Putative Zn(II)2Cys6 transcription factor n=1 Tax=Aspergillus mulundensis TaxID=1810919 RepID=A0A3D8QFN6_9EURO|nr:putative Zn(II)2Cys6 transcription factor [Aspergillus mulundensis]RDW60488.1 putative Zn(II)2Cys6 transcription factor [Aspergillus mulundensis]